MIRVIDPVYGFLPDEKQVVIGEDVGGNWNRLAIHPWVRSSPKVYIALGALKKNGVPKSGISKGAGGDEEGQRYDAIIVNREDFVEAIIAVFPELKRAGV